MVAGLITSRIFICNFFCIHLKKTSQKLIGPCFEFTCDFMDGLKNIFWYCTIIIERESRMTKTSILMRTINKMRNDVDYIHLWQVHGISVCTTYLVLAFAEVISRAVDESCHRICRQLLVVGKRGAKLCSWIYNSTEWHWLGNIWGANFFLDLIKFSHFELQNSINLWYWPLSIGSWGHIINKLIYFQKYKNWSLKNIILGVCIFYVGGAFAKNENFQNCHLIFWKVGRMERDPLGKPFAMFGGSKWKMR